MLRARLLPEIGQRGVGAAAVIVVGVDDGERAVQLVLGAEHGVTRAPRLHASLRGGEALRQDVVLLIDIGGFNMTFHAAGQLPEFRVDGVLDDENDLAEAGRHCVIDGIMQKTVAVAVNGGDLLQSAEAAAHSGRHDDKRWFFHVLSSFLCSFVMVSASITQICCFRNCFCRFRRLYSTGSALIAEISKAVRCSVRSGRRLR